MNFHSGLEAGFPQLALRRPYRWYYVRSRFETFLENLTITEDQTNDGQTKHTQGAADSGERVKIAAGLRGDPSAAR